MIFLSNDMAPILAKIKAAKKYLVIPVVIIIAVGLFLLWDNVIRTPQYAKNYDLSPSSCTSQENICTNISFAFVSSRKALNEIPRYLIQDFPEDGKTKVTFYNTTGGEKQFSYEEIINNPLIDRLDYYQEGKDFIIDISRKGNYLPTEISQNGANATIVLKEGDKNYPIISNQKPLPDSSTWPSNPRTISFEANLEDSLKEVIVFFQDKKVDVSTNEFTKNQYYFAFEENIEKDKQYSVKAIIIDNQNRVNIGVWGFEGQILSEITLGKDRFKYLGWWGEINATGVSVREKPSVFSQKLGTLSSINKVKVLREVYGGIVDNNSIWYEIDGGQYPHAYVFSEYVTPITQPEPPKTFTIPEEVKQGEYWIDVDITKKIITLFEYDKSVFSSYVAVGREENPTEPGIYKVWYKLRKAEMKGGPPLHTYKYDLKDIPSVMYYNGSYAIHGTYWHDRFGSQQSAGCTNLTQGDAAFIFEKTNPKLTDMQQEIFSSAQNPGTVVYNHY